MPSMKTAWPVLARPIVDEDCDVNIRELLGLMVEVTRKYTGSTNDWQFSKSDSLEDLVPIYTHRLPEMANIDHREILNDHESLRLILKRYIGNRSTVYLIPILSIVEMKHRNRPLYHILLSS